MKKLAAFCAFLLLVNTSYAQTSRGERVKALRTAYITDKLHLTSQQAALFWPVFNEYSEEVQRMNHTFSEKYGNTDLITTDDATARAYIDDNIAKDEKHLALKRKYKNDFLKVISPQQLAQLFNVDREFNRMLVDQLKQRRDRENEHHW